MPKRTINTRRNKATDAATTEQPATLGELLASTEQPATEQLATEQPATEQPTDTALPVDIDPAIANDSDLSTAEKLFLHSLPDTATEQPATSDAVPVAATPAKPDAKAEFLERKSAATLSALSQYGGASLAVHRSDKQPSDSAYLARVASPVQKIGPNGPTVRDNSFILAIYDHLSVYHGGDYSAAFNPAHFGADLGTTSRAASVGYLELSACGQYIHLTDAGRVRGVNLATKRDKA